MKYVNTVLKAYCAIKAYVKPIAPKALKPIQIKIINKIIETICIQKEYFRYCAAMYKRETKLLIAKNGSKSTKYFKNKAASFTEEALNFPLSKRIEITSVENIKAKALMGTTINKRNLLEVTKTIFNLL